MSNTITINNYYSKRANERRRQFNKLINSCNMILMNGIADVDESVLENWQGESPFAPEPCEFDNEQYCETHDCMMTELSEGEPCSFAEDYTDGEIYQWFAVADSDADFLKRHGQYITYSDMLDTYFMAITHFGTAWDYVDSMVEAFDDCYVNLDQFSDDKEDN